MACNNSATLMVESKSKAGQQQQQPQQQHLNQLAKATDKSSSSSGKSLLDRDNLRDEDFDKLVIDVSNLIQDKEQSGKLLANSATRADSIDGAAGEGLPFGNSQDDSNSQDAHSNRLNNQPKRPMNAFMVWGRAIRREIHLRFSNVQNALLSKALGRVWRSLDQVDKEPYVRKANLIKAKHRRDYPNYRYQPRRLQEAVDKGQKEAAINNNRPSNCSQINYALDKKNCRPIGRDQLPLDNVNTIHQQRIKHAGAGSHVRDGRPDGLVFAANQSHAVATLTYQDNNHIDAGYTGYCAGAGAACSGGGGGGGSGATVGPSGGAYLRTQYNDGYHINHQQHRSVATREQPSDCSYHLNCQPQFAYNMQPQQQHQQTYQQSYVEISQVTASSGTNYGDSCSFSAARNSDQTRYMLPTSIATNSGQTKVYESRNNRLINRISETGASLYP